MLSAGNGVKTLNEDFMESSASKAREGLLSMTKIRLFPGQRLYRFANSRRSDLYYAGPWWIAFSPFESLKMYAKLRGQSLSLAARESLAIDWAWSNVDVLVQVIIKAHLSAWSGTPKTQVPKDGLKYKGVRWEPDRDITQLFIPGLDQVDPSDSKLLIWQSAFLSESYINIARI